MLTGKLLGAGLLSSELPTSFSTDELWENLSDIQNIVSPEKESACAFFNAPKKSGFRRIFEIPNPIHQIRLCSLIIDNWEEIFGFISKSKISMSKPIEDDKGERAVVKEYKFNEFKNACEIQAYQFKYKLKLDIASFFPSIYTHALGWALHGRANARKMPNLLGNQLDNAVRRTKKQQSVGIPIGPDTSIVLSEIIGTHIDIFIQEKFPDYVGGRFVDDYNLYFDTRSQAEKCLEGIETFLSELRLTLNDGKTYITETMDPTDDLWVVSLASFEISQNSDHQCESIKRFFSLIFSFSKTKDGTSAAKFGINKMLNTLANNEIHKANYEIFNSLLFRVCLHHPECLGETFKFIDQHREFFVEDMIKNLCIKILQDCCLSARNYEIIWCLWLLARLQISLTNKDLIFSLSKRVGLETIQLLDMDSNGLLSVQPEIDITNIGRLVDDNWMLAYTLQKRGWTKMDLIQKNDFFVKLKDLDVDFFNIDNASSSNLIGGSY